MSDCSRCSHDQHCHERLQSLFTRLTLPSATTIAVHTASKRLRHERLLQLFIHIDGVLCIFRQLRGLLAACVRDTRAYAKREHASTLGAQLLIDHARRRAVCAQVQSLQRASKLQTQGVHNASFETRAGHALETFG